MNPDYDIIVVGAGPAALSFARAMRSCPLQITLLEQASKNSIVNPRYDGRDIALTHASRALLQELGIWQLLDEDLIHPIHKASVIDGKSPYALQFDGSKKSYDELGFIVSNHLIRQTLYRATKKQQNLSLEFESRLSSISTTGDGYVLKLDDGRSFSTRLLIAADSRYSTTRSQAGIAADINDFACTAIVARMRHETAHDHTAFECFHYGHTLAVLPLASHESSVVVTANTDRANKLASLDEEEFASFVCENFKHRLGPMKLSSPRFSYPLVGVHAKQFVKQGFALIGDAAVGMHPVTAHGFNLGLSSANLLATEITRAAARGQDYSSEKVLRAYQARHITETRLMYYGTNGIVKLFTDEHLPAKLARKVVLRLANCLPPLKWAIEKKLTAIKSSQF